MQKKGCVMESKGLRIVAAILRFVMAVTFLWAFFDKVIGISKPGKGWVNGNSPTKGFLSGSTGPFSAIFKGIAGTGIADWLFMLALLGVGIALLLGIGMKIGTISGAVLMFLMWSAALPKAGNIFQLDDHVTNLLVLLILLFAKAGQTAGLGKWWANTKLVKRLPGLE